MSDESRYILNELYIKDYIVWVQALSKSKLHSFGEWLDESNVDLKQTNDKVLEETDLQNKKVLGHQNKHKIHKPDVGFNLDQIEAIFCGGSVSDDTATTVSCDGGDGEDGSQSSDSDNSSSSDDDESDVQSSLDSDDEPEAT